MRQEFEEGEAYFSDDERYRYGLVRCWDAKKPHVMFIGLNPSTADATKLDQTLRKIVGFSVREGFGGFYMGNLFAFRATDPKVMKRADDPVGPDNDEWLQRMAAQADKIVACWGTDGGLLDRDASVVAGLCSEGHRLFCLGKTMHGYPCHPLYLARTTELELFA